MKAIAANVLIAEAQPNQLVNIEGNWYFPSAAISPDVLQQSDTPYTCPWKGQAQYFDVAIEGRRLRDAAWSYPAPLASAISRVGRDFAGFVAFDRLQVQVIA